MRGALAAAGAIAWVTVACSPWPARIRADHAREFGCEQRWVEVSGLADRRYQATGCGFRSEWTCRDRTCRMDDHRAYGVGGP